MENRKDAVKELKEKVKDLNDLKFLEYILSFFGDTIEFASSFGIEDQVLTDLLLKIKPDMKIFTVDSGRLPQETYDVIEETRKKYSIDVEILFPDHNHIEEMVNNQGPNLFYENSENRKLCCSIRRVLPSQRKIESIDSWITGLRREQADTRSEIDRVDWDEANQNIKINPLAFWTLDMVWDYAKKHNVPYNKLHDKNFPSIGCICCTGPVKPGDHPRAGRWWWETDEVKECGIHLVDGQIKRLKNRAFE